MSNLKLIYGNIIDKLRNEIAENEAKHEAALEKEREASLFVMRRLQGAMNEKNRMALAEQVVDSMDMKTMIQMIYEDLLSFYEGQDGDEYFQRDWEMMNE